MRRFLMILFLLGSLFVASASDAITGRIVKVLPLFLNLNAQDAISPSLYDRDAYQIYLRNHTNEVSAIRYDVQWSAKNAGEGELKIRLELRGVSAPNNLPEFKTLTAPATPGFLDNWPSLTLAGDEYKNFGAVTAWRATLWDGDRQIGEQKSFLW